MELPRKYGRFHDEILCSPYLLSDCLVQIITSGDECLSRPWRIGTNQPQRSSVWTVGVEEGREMIQVCYYNGCGVIYGEKEPLSDKSETHGLCPKHLRVALKEIKAKMEKLSTRPEGLTALVVEDSTLFRQLFKETLHDRFPSVAVHEAVNGKEAMRKIETLHPNLVFMDIRLPGENGLELTQKIKTQYPDMIVIILTGYDLPEYRQVSSQYADYFFSKDSSTAESIFTVVESIFPARV